MKIAIIGAKGIPANYGGYETFAEKISLILRKDNDMLVVGDGSNDYKEKEFNGIHTLNCTYLKSKNPIKFYHESLKIANKWGADVSIMCGIGGVFSIPFFRSSKMKIFVNPDGLGFKRDKWPWWKKIALFTQYLFGALFSKYLICDSYAISNFFKTTLNRKKNVFVAEYGSDLITLEKCTDFNCENYLEDLNIKKDNYFLIVSRLEPENNVKTIIKGYLKSSQIFPLIIIGNLNTSYSKKLKQFESINVRFIGGVYDKERLSVLRHCSKAYFHGHSVGGTNPSLLEAMAAGNVIIAHDNEFNKEVLNNKGYFFKEEEDISKILMKFESEEFDSEQAYYRSEYINRIINYYSWEKIAQKYLSILIENT